MGGRQAVGAMVTGWVLACMAGRAWALSDKDILLYAPMDGSADARVSRGNPKPHLLTQPRFAPGKVGQGLLTGTDGSRLAYVTRGNIDPEAGTVALWVKPIKWYQKDRFMRFWFRVGEEADAGGRGQGSFLWLYKYLNSVPLYWLVQQDYRQRAVATVGCEDAYRAGQWTHIAASWGGPVMRLFVNGRHIGTGRTITPRVLRNFGAHFMIGGGSWTTDGIQPKEPDSVIDEVYVLRRPVTTAEVQLLMAKGRAAFTGKAMPPELELRAGYFPSRDRLELRLMTNGRRPGDVKGLTATVSVMDVDTARPCAIDAQTQPVRAVDAQQAVDTRTLPPGRYRALAALSAGGRVCSLRSADFEKPAKPEWLGNRIGVPDTVPAPWTPIKRSGQTIACWGRTVAYRDSLFPVQMTSQGQALLAGPIRVSAGLGKQTIRPQGTTFQWKQVAPLRAAFAASARLGPATIRADGWMAFDGFVWTRLSVPAVSGKRLNGLRLEIPLRRDVATLQHGALCKHEPNNGKVYDWHFPLLGQPFLWLGNEEVGLQWCTGDDYCWDNTDRSHQIELKVTDREVTLAVTMLDHAVALDRELSFTFGLHPTPVKPLPKGWRRYDLGMNGWWHDAVGRGKPVCPTWAFWYQKWNLQNEATKKDRWLVGYQVPGPWTRKLVEGTVAEGARPFLYWALHGVWRAAPAYAAFRSEWRPDNPPALPRDTAGNKFGPIWRAVPSFHDWAIWRYWKTFTDHPWLAKSTGGLYNDVVQGFWGVEPKPDRQGEMRTRHELLGMRQLQKRLYVTLQKNWPHLVIANHQSGDSHLSQLAFVHAYITGENYRGHALLGKEQGYYHVMDLASCRAELLGGHWGVPIIFLPETTSSGVSMRRAYSDAGIASSEHLAGLLLVHDVIPWNALTHPIPLMRLAALKEAFGWDDQTRYVGYWKTAGLVKLTADRSPVVVSVFLRPGKAMLAVMNNSDADATVTLAPDWAKLGVAEPTEMTDAYTAARIPNSPFDWKMLNKGKVRLTKPNTPVPVVTVPVRNHQVRFPVRRRNFRVWVTP